jgi:hypothetical protein
MHVALRACSRALLREGNKIAISSDMIEITTSNSISVKANVLRLCIAKASLNNFLKLFITPAILVLLFWLLSDAFIISLLPHELNKK